MAFNINTSQNPQFSPAPTGPAIQDWSFDVPSTVERFYIPGQSLPPNIVINVNVRDYPTLLQDDNTYSSIILKVLFIFTSGDWNTVSTNIDVNGSDLSSSLDYQYTIAFQNLSSNLPPQGTNLFSGAVLFRVLGVRQDNGFLELLGQNSRQIKLFYIFNDFLAILPNQINFNHILNDPLPSSKTFQVLCTVPFWISVEKSFDLVGFDSSNALDLGTAYWYQMQPDPSGITSFEVVPNEAIEDVVDEVVTVGEALIAFTLDENNLVLYQEPTSISYFTSSTGEILITPDELTFFMIIGLDEDVSQTVSIASPFQANISAPSWLILSTNQIQNFGDLIVEPISSSNFEPGIYEDQVTITVDGIDYFIYVQLEVVQNIRLNLTQTGLNFTDENTRFTQLFSLEQTNQAGINVNISDIGYPSAFRPDKNFNYTTGFFNNRSKIHIGEIVKRSVHKINLADFKITFESYFEGNFNTFTLLKYYNVIRVGLILSILDQNGLTGTVQEEFNDLNFILGRKPLVKDRFAFLNAKPVPLRVTKNSLSVVNYVSDQLRKLYLWKNGSVISSFNHPFNEFRIYGILIVFDDYNIGDRLKLSETNTALIADEIKQEFIVFPEGKQSNHIFFADEYGVVRAFEFTGDWSIGSEYNFIESSRYQNLVEFFRNENTVKVQNITINTGWIPKSNQYYVDLIIRSGMAWLTTNDTENVVELVPKSKELSNTDSDRELYAYDVTFKINRSHDLQNYS